MEKEKKNRHNWEKTFYEADKKRDHYECKCGAKSYVLPSGNRIYLNEDGKCGATNSVSSCPLTHDKNEKRKYHIAPPANEIIPEQLPHVAHEAEQSNAGNGLPQTQANSASHSIRSFQRDKRPPLLGDQAKQFDLLLILNIMFEDMIIAGVRTVGRDMAGRYLYSNGYAEKVKELENR